MLKDFPKVEKRPAFTDHRYPGCMIENSSISCAILCKVWKIQQFEAGAGVEPSAKGIGTVYSVAVTRQLIHDGAYIASIIRKSLSPEGDTTSRSGRGKL